MLALEPNAQVSSSTQVHPGVPSSVAAGIGQLDLALFVSQRAVFEWISAPSPGTRVLNQAFVDTIAGVVSYVTPLQFSFAVNWGFLRPNPADTARFQILRKLHIVYPADPADPKKVKGGGQFPVVVLVHGNHNVIETTAPPPASLESYKTVQSHMGYTHLQNELASHGIVSVSVDTNAANALNAWIEMRAESVLGALDEMWAMHEDPASMFHRRLDFSNVGLMGHSRGGDAVVRAAILNSLRIAGQYGIKAVCSIAPTDFTGMTVQKRVLTSSHTQFYAVVAGALDADVSGRGGAQSLVGTGFRHYDRAQTRKAMVFLDSCNHNRFNTLWKPDDNHELTDIPRLLSAAGHQQVMNDYVGGLFRWQLLGAKAPESLFDGSTVNSAGEKGAIQWSFWRQYRLILEEFETAGATVSNMADVIVGGTKVADHTNHQASVLYVKPHTSSTPFEAWRVDLPSSQQDWSQWDEFTFRVCADADLSSKTTVGDPAKSPLPEFTFVFTDSAGGSANVTAASLRTAERPRPPVFHHPKWETRNAAGVVIRTEDENCSVIRLETFAIKVASLGGVDRTKMKSVQLLVPAFAKYQFFDSFVLVTR